MENPLEVPSQDLSKIIKKTLIDRDLTVATLADRIGKSRQYVSTIINHGKAESRIMQEVLDALGIRQKRSGRYESA
jgi:hypothetical protein